MLDFDAWVPTPIYHGTIHLLHMFFEDCRVVTCIRTRQTSIGHEQKDATHPETAPTTIRASAGCNPNLAFSVGRQNRGKETRDVCLATFKWFLYRWEA